MVQVKQLKTGEDVYYANKYGVCPLCGRDFQLNQEVAEIETEELPWTLCDGSRTITILVHMDCLRKLF